MNLIFCKKFFLFEKLEICSATTEDKWRVKQEIWRNDILFAKHPVISYDPTFSN